MIEKATGDEQGHEKKERHWTHISNKATTSSVETKLSISGWICLSMYNLLKGKIVMGPGLK